MRAPSFLVFLGIAALLLGCQAPAPNGSIDDLPHSNPTSTSKDLATGS